MAPPRIFDAKDDMNLAERLVAARTTPMRTKIVRQIFAWIFHVDFPTTVEVGENFTMLHRGVGCILHPATKIGNNVTLAPYSGTGSLNPGNDWSLDEFPKIFIEDDVMIGVDAKILAPHEGLTIGKGTVIGAASVLTKSTGPGEVWAGVPAKRVK